MTTSRVALWAALALAVAATAGRATFARFPVGAHFDEEIIGLLGWRAVNGKLSANWAGFEPFKFSRPTYQFSPYTLLEGGLARIGQQIVNWPARVEEHIYFARGLSVVMGGSTVLAAYLAGMAWFGRPAAALVGAAFLALSFLHVQDSCYARVEAMLALSAMLCLAAAGRTTHAVDARHVRRWAAATGCLAGLTVAAKYNAIPVLVLLAAPWFADCAVMNRAQRCLAIVLGALASVVGFVAATPELPVDPAPFWEGLRYEAGHYATGHIPHQAFDAWDNNLVFWIEYFARLGFGWIPTVLAVAFVLLAWQRGGAWRLLTICMLAAAAILLCARVRFDRNGEILLGAACLGAGTVAVELFDAWRGRWPRFAWVVAFGLGGVVVIQNGLALTRFLAVQQSEASPHARMPRSVPRANVHRQILWESPPEDWRRRQILILDGFSDRFSHRALAEWLPLLSDYDLAFYRSPWLTHGYPFSTVEIYHGPGFILVATRKGNGRL